MNLGTYICWHQKGEGRFWASVLRNSLIAASIVRVSFIELPTQAQETTKLVDSEGRVLEAQVEKVSDGEVSIKRKDGKRFTLPVSKFGFRTQHFLQNWTERGILEQTMKGTLHAAEVRAKVHGGASTRTLTFRNSAGKALINANHISEAIAYLKETSNLWSESGSSGWDAFRAKHLLGYAMLLDNPTPKAEQLFLAGVEGMIRTQEGLGQPEFANLLMSHATQRAVWYFDATNPGKSARWKKLFGEYRSRLKKSDPLTIELGRMRARQTPHFIVASPFSSIGDYARVSEEAWGELALILPALKTDFEKGAFMTPYGRMAPLDQYGEDRQFRFLLVLPDKKTMEPIITGYLKTITDSKKRDSAFSLATVNGFIEDKDNRFLVARIRDPKQYSDTNENWTFHRVIHNMPEALLKLTLRTSREPFWLSTGLGYHLEHKLTDVASVHYSGYDFDRVGFKRGTDWHDPVKKLVSTGTNPDMKRIIWGGRRREEDYGFMFALAEMLLADPKKKALLGDFVLQRRQNPSFMNEKEISLWFGYENPEAMSLALRVFIRSKDFR